MEEWLTVGLILIAVTLSGCLGGPAADNESADASTEFESAVIQVQNTDDVSHTISVSVEMPNETTVTPLRVSANSTEAVSNITTNLDGRYNVTARALGGPEVSHSWTPNTDGNLTVRYDGEGIEFGGSGPDRAPY
jgi:hypothetical protein